MCGRHCGVHVPRSRTYTARWADSNKLLLVVLQLLATAMTPCAAAAAVAAAVGLTTAPLVPALPLACIPSPLVGPNQPRPEVVPVVECKPGSDAVWATKHWPWQRITTVINMKGNASALICTAHSHGVAVLVNVQPAAVAAFGGWVNYTNDLANASSRERAAIAIAASTHLSGYDGVVLDIESNDPRNRDAVSSFAATVRARLRERNPHATLVFGTGSTVYLNGSKGAWCAISSPDSKSVVLTENVMVRFDYTSLLFSSFFLALSFFLLKSRPRRPNFDYLALSKHVDWFFVMGYGTLHGHREGVAAEANGDLRMIDAGLEWCVHTMS